MAARPQEGENALKPEELADKLAAILLERKCYFSELLLAHRDVDYRTFLLGWSALRERYPLWRNEDGCYFRKEQS